MTLLKFPKQGMVDNTHQDFEYGIKVCRGIELLKESPRNLKLINQTKQTISVTKEVWDAYYFPVIARVASLMQRLPASESYHHHQVNGLLVHSLEVMSNACRISRGYILPPDSETESISTNAQRWRAGVMIAALLHDVGKLLLDIEIMVTIDGKNYKRFYPLFDTWPENGFYRFRYATKKTGHTKKLHERAAPLSFHKVINKRIFEWLCEDPLLMQYLLDTLCYCNDPNNVLSEIVLKADRASVARSIGGNLSQELSIKTDKKVSVEDKAISVINRIVDDLDCKFNRKGALFWKTATHTFFVSQRLMEDVLRELRKMGIEDTPKEGDRLQMLLSNQGFFEKSPMSDSEIVWLMSIKDYTNDWTVNLTMLAVKNEKLNVSTIPIFGGELVLLDRKNKRAPTEFVFSTMTQPIEKPDLTSTPIEPQVKDTLDLKDTEINGIKQEPEINENLTEHFEGQGSKSSMAEHVSRISLRGIDNDLVKAMQNMTDDSKIEILNDNHFYKWLVNGISTRQVRVNEPDAFIHVVGDYVLLVTPKVFNRYLKKNPFREAQYEAITTGKTFTAVQHEFDSLRIHIRDGGSNHKTVAVTGQNRSGFLTVYVLPRKLFPICDNFASNPAITFKD